MSSPVVHAPLIAFFGLPGTGKSTLAATVANQLSATCFLEPEEAEWPAAVLERATSGSFTAISWFRSVRVPMLYSGSALRDNGEPAVIDSYYDKLLKLYLDQDAMRWLISRMDPYYEVVKALANLDYIHLPDADILVLLTLSREDWHYLLSTRNRGLDNDAEVRRSFSAQPHFRDVARRYCTDSGAQLIEVERDISDPRIDAERILDRISAWYKTKSNI